MIEPHLNFLDGKLRAWRFFRALKADVFRHQTGIPTQAQAGEPEVQSALVQFFQQWLLNKTGQADLVQVT